ncbi:MAG: hypothetical protein ACTSU5_15985 [Promethearchaeota archaeon]
MAVTDETTPESREAPRTVGRDPYLEERRHRFLERVRLMLDGSGVQFDGGWREEFLRKIEADVRGMDEFTLEVTSEAVSGVKRTAAQLAGKLVKTREQLQRALALLDRTLEMLGLSHGGGGGR